MTSLYLLNGISGLWEHLTFCSWQIWGRKVLTLLNKIVTHLHMAWYQRLPNNWCACGRGKAANDHIPDIFIQRPFSPGNESAWMSRNCKCPLFMIVIAAVSGLISLECVKSKTIMNTVSGFMPQHPKQRMHKGKVNDNTVFLLPLPLGACNFV